ncbi:MAG: MFS transporter [Ancrocorticia sp.]|uniref:MFS transporter n=1 Tax=Ancrocorticia sp. TaxID=2593684 RepID=UPI003F9274F2
MRLLNDLKVLAQNSGFRKLIGVRLVSQCGDGMFQAGLASLFFFRPEAMTDAAGVAAALVVMLLPFSIVGPFTGPFLDRWRRRQVLLYGNLIRAGLVLLAVAADQLYGDGPVIYTLALVILGLSRFMLAGLSAGLPMVVGSKERLLMANSVVPTLGGVATAVGAIFGFLLRLLLPEGASQQLASLVVACLLYLGASAVARMLGKDELGPEAPDSGSSLGAQVKQAAMDLVDAVRYLAKRGTPGLALSTMALHRFVYGMQLITIILAGRNLLVDPLNANAGIAAFGTLMGAMVAGHGVAVVLTPIAHEKMAPSQWVVLCLISGTLGQLFIVFSHQPAIFAAGMFIFGIGVQGAKIAVDTIVQSDTADAYRGRAFSIYDVLFNVAECLAAGLAIFILPDIGWSRPVQISLIVFVWIVALGYRHLVRGLGDQPRVVA